MSKVSVELFGSDPKVLKSVGIAKAASMSNDPIVIVGEVGVGKKTICRYIHENSSRADFPLLTVDCSSDATDVENMILGHRDDSSGRFVKGVLEAANGGSVVFANIDGLDENFQKRLHKILVELEDYDISVRIMATTTKNLSKLVGTGRFYRGLYTYAASTMVTLSPLRERPNDLEHLVRHFIAYYTQTNDVKFSDDALQKLVSHYWTYNVQELKAVIENSIRNCDEDIITEHDLEIGEKRTLNISMDDESEGIRLMSLKEAERLLIKKALIHTSENRTQAAKILGVSIRTLRNKINEYRGEGNAYFVNLR